MRKFLSLFIIWIAISTIGCTATTTQPVSVIMNVQCEETFCAVGDPIEAKKYLVTFTHGNKIRTFNTYSDRYKGIATLNGYIIDDTLVEELCDGL